MRRMTADRNNQKQLQTDKNGKKQIEGEELQSCRFEITGRGFSLLFPRAVADAVQADFLTLRLRVHLAAEFAVVDLSKNT